MSVSVENNCPGSKADFQRSFLFCVWRVILSAWHIIFHIWQIILFFSLSNCTFFEQGSKQGLIGPLCCPGNGGGARRGVTAAAAAAVGPRGGQSGGGTHQNTVQSPKRLYKALEQYTKTYNTTQSLEIFNKSSNKY